MASLLAKLGCVAPELTWTTSFIILEQPETIVIPFVLASSGDVVGLVGFSLTSRFYSCSQYFNGRLWVIPMPRVLQVCLTQARRRFFNQHRYAQHTTGLYHPPGQGALTERPTHFSQDRRNTPVPIKNNIRTTVSVTFGQHR